jgi:hypothetical protein
MVRKKVWPLLLAACSAIFASLLIITTDQNGSEFILQANGMPNFKEGQQLPMVSSTATTSTSTTIGVPGYPLAPPVVQYPVLPAAGPYPAPLVSYAPPYAPGPSYVNILPRPAVLPRPSIPPVQYYNYPAVNSALDGQDEIGKWSDLFQRVNDELTTDTMEIANLENQVSRDFFSRLRGSAVCIA